MDLQPHEWGFLTRCFFTTDDPCDDPAPWSHVSAIPSSVSPMSQKWLVMAHHPNEKKCWYGVYINTYIYIYIYSICIYVCTVYVYMYVQYIHSDNTVAFVKQTG